MRSSVKRAVQPSPAELSVKQLPLVIEGALGLTPPSIHHRMSTLNFAIIGCGGITLQNHLPGLALCPEAKVVALCDTDAGTLQRASRQTGINVTATRYEEIVKRDDVEAVIIATPNFAHAPIALAAIAAGKH